MADASRDSSFDLAMAHYLDGAIADRAAAALNARLRDDAAAREAFVNCCRLLADLHEHAAVTPRAFEAVETKTIVPAPRFGWRAVAAILIGLAAVAAYFVSTSSVAPHAGTNSNEPAIATLIASEDVTWSSSPRMDGESLTTGRLAIAAGKIELLIGGRVMAQLHGPATLDLSSAGLVHLDRGRIDVDAVPGFTVTAPGFVVTDLGTRFSVAVDAQGRGEVFVHKGTVSLAAGRSGFSGQLFAGQGASIDGGIVASLSASQSQLARLPRPTILADWTFDNLPIGSALAEGQRLGDAAADRRDAFVGPGAEPQVIAGPAEYGATSALHFDKGENPVIFRGNFGGFTDAGESAGDAFTFGPADSFTLEAIVRTRQSVSGAIVANDVGSNRPSWWLRVDQKGVARFLICDGPTFCDVTSPMPINDGVWHHVAAVRDAEQHKLRLYVDGELVSEADDTTHRSLANDHDIRIGAFNAPGRSLVGDIDRVRIASKALPPERFIHRIDAGTQ
ncbi:MAG: hypothetical protein GC162_07660 [Planctomycetes bacterium]|nr:hypothetical protein [Planctomycetota bacterium]